MGVRIAWIRKALGKETVLIAIPIVNPQSPQPTKGCAKIIMNFFIFSLVFLYKVGIINTFRIAPYLNRNFFLGVVFHTEVFLQNERRR
jgi:hypothetical protein